MHSPSDPGTGVGGGPNKPGANCDPLGSVLIIQEPDSHCPDDNADGGIIVFDFFITASYVYDIGLLDID
jgi:hypothetical protein